MNKREAKRIAHGLVARQIGALLLEEDLLGWDDSPEDGARIREALEELEYYHVRKQDLPRPSAHQKENR